MVYDTLQKRLGEMEKENPSENKHKRSLSDILSDTRDFLERGLKREVEQIAQKEAHYHTPEEMAKDLRIYFRDTARQNNLSRYGLMQIGHAVKLAGEGWPREEVEDRISIAEFWTRKTNLDRRGMRLLHELIDWNCPS